MTFQIGQRVLALSDWIKSKNRFPLVILPKKHHIYTVRAFCPNAPESAILLEEICNTQVVTFASGRKGEPSFGTSLFRPLFDLSQLFEISKEIENV